MGCDIHLILECKNDDGKWVGINNFNYISNHALGDPKDSGSWYFWTVRSRNYELFGKLAGVRRQSLEGPKPRGIPADASELARMEIDHFGGDGHSHSWGLLSEIGGYFLAMYWPNQMLEEHRHERIQELFGIQHEGPLDNFRLVYFFDN
jgi:hypothetical protein